MRRYDRPEDEWVGVRFPPLVDEEIWDLAQEVKKRRLTHSCRNTRLFYLLQHLVRWAECGYLMGCRANRRQTSRRNGKNYIYDLDTPHRYYRCYGMEHKGAQCRERPYIRAERLEALVWGEVKKVLENPGVIVAGIEAMDSRADNGELTEEIAISERELQKFQMEEDRAIRLYVSGKIIEKQLDRQRKFITERLETLRFKLDDYRAREMAEAKKRALGEHIVQWAHQVGGRLEDLSDKERREVLRLILDGATIDGRNNVDLTLAIPTEEVVSIAGQETQSRTGRPSGSRSGRDRSAPVWGDRWERQCPIRPCPPLTSPSCRERRRWPSSPPP